MGEISHNPSKIQQRDIIQEKHTKKEPPNGGSFGGYELQK